PGGSAGREGAGSTGRSSSGTGSATPRGGAGPAGSGSRAQGSTTSGRRRATRKATLGSTSYDEARDATDPRWAGASWYGPTTGEYWIVNPREYADPRKHGPGYSSRLRTGSGLDEPGLGQSAADVPPDAAADPPTAEAMGAGAPTTSADAMPRQEPGDEPFIDAIVRSGSPDPLRRLGLVLLAWAPVGIAATAVIGQLTGCASYSAACDGTDPFLPWVAQAIIVGLLLVVPPLARVFAAGTVGLVIGLVPVTGLVIALGGAGSAAAPPVLAAVLAIAWILGAAWGTRRLTVARATEPPVAPPGGRP
ncbi:MAG TPA: hypothetical protein VIU37_00955, partial [Candidatus Limnocylindrales bacterium]